MLVLRTLWRRKRGVTRVSGRRGLVEAAAASRRRSSALRLPYDAAVTSQHSDGGLGFLPQAEVSGTLPVTFKHREDPAAFQALSFSARSWASVLGR